MCRLKSRFQTFEIPPHLQVVGITVLILLAFIMLWFNNINSSQAQSALLAQVKFQGEYRIGDGEWQNYIEGQHIPATKGDVTLRGKFCLFTPEGDYVGVYDLDLPIAFYTDHVNLMIYEGENNPYVIDMENPLYDSTLCGEGWTAYSITGDGSQPIEIVVHNPHHFGNETAVDELLSNVAIWDSIDFESAILARGKTQRNLGAMVIIVSVFLLGAALFSLLLRIRNSILIIMPGATFFFAGLYLEYSAPGVSFWRNTITANTSVLGLSMMLYMMLICCVVTYCLKETKRIGTIAALILGIVDGLCFLMPIVFKMKFYDTWMGWILAQTLVNLILLVCLIKESMNSENKMRRWIYAVLSIVLIAFEADAVSSLRGWWQSGLVSMYVFFVLFVAALFVILKFVPESFNAAEKAREMEQQKIRLEAEKSIIEAELKESRVSTMMSQIRPHFIYNTLGSIEQLCELDPPKAGELVHNFAKYLRGNFGELDNPKPIRMSQEMEHVRHYISIESVRFPDMSFSCEINSEDFKLPALTVQPIVENSIKHGLMKLKNGGSIHVETYETDSQYCISVEDDGVGFDTRELLDDKKHIGIRNIRDRLKVMVGGTLEIESTQGVGTKVLIKIPKEV